MTMSDGGAIRTVFAFNDGVMARNLEGLGEPEARTAVGLEGNSISWIVGHLVFWRQEILGGLGSPPLLDGVALDGYRGTSRDQPPEDTVPWGRLVDAWGRSADLLVEQLEAAPPSDEASHQRLLKLAVHESYHAGQIGLARRALGLPGVI